MLAPLNLAAVLELTGHAARDNKETRINPRHLQLAVRNEEELSKLLGGVTIAQHPRLNSVQNWTRIGRQVSVMARRIKNLQPVFLNTTTL